MTPAFHPLADAELTDAASLYEAAERGLDEAFLQEIERLLALLDIYPEVGLERALGIRTLAARRFPYTLVYQLGASEPLILAVAHNRRQPHYWAGTDWLSGGITEDCTSQPSYCMLAPLASLPSAASEPGRWAGYKLLRERLTKCDSTSTYCRKRNSSISITESLRDSGFSPRSAPTRG